MIWLIYRTQTFTHYATTLSNIDQIVAVGSTVRYPGPISESIIKGLDSRTAVENSHFQKFKLKYSISKQVHGKLKLLIRFAKSGSEIIQVLVFMTSIIGGQCQETTKLATKHIQ